MKLTRQTRNANRHTERGMTALASSIQSDGWIGAITVAADGETFDGSARLDVGGVQLDDAIVVRSDGSRPVVHIREDIPAASDARAVRLGLAANRIAELNLDFDPAILAAIGADLDLSGLWDRDEWAALMPREPGAGGDDFDTTPHEGPTRVQPGELWHLGEHRLLCGDSTNAEDVARLMDGERAALGFADPPYGSGVDTWDSQFLWDHDSMIDLCRVVVVTPGIVSIQEFLGLTTMPYKWSIGCWISNGRARSAIGFGNWIYAAVFSKDSVYRQAQDFCKIDLVNGQREDAEGHRGQKPLLFVEWVVGLLSEDKSLVYDPFLGSGTTLIAAHRTGRRCYGLEIEPKYCDVILRRFEAETGIAPQRVD